MLYTKEQVRDQIRNRDGRRVFYLGKEDLLTNEARDYLTGERIEILPAEQAKPQRYRLLNGAELTEKPENMTNLNGEIELACKDHFDFDSLKVLEFQERTLRIEENDIEEILNFKKGPLTFMILSLLYPELKLGEIKWHQDHIHPQYAFERKRLIKYFAEKGVEVESK